jgi:two-component system, OmpR family, response regulator
MTTVYILEAQELFGPELERLAALAGGRVAARSAVLDLDAIISTAPDIVLLDLDYTAYDVLDVLAVLRDEAPAIRPVVLSAERTRGWIARCRGAGAAAVVSKAGSEYELVHDLRVIFDGGTVWDVRVEAG